MPYTKEIADQDKVIADCKAAQKKAWDRKMKATDAFSKAENALADANKRRFQLGKLQAGGKPYDYVHHGDAYRTTAVTGIEDEVQFWSDDMAKEKVAKRSHSYAYIVLLEADAKTYKALVYLNEHADIKAAKLRKLLKLPALG